MRRTLLLVPLLAAAPALAQRAPEPVDQEAIDFIKAETSERGQVMDHATWMTDVHGARLTASEPLDRAQAWAVERFQMWGVDAELEPWGTFGRGWSSDRFSMSARVSGPDVAAQSFPLTAAPKAWSPSTGRASGELVTIDVERRVARRGRARLEGQSRPHGRALGRGAGARPARDAARRARTPRAGERGPRGDAGRAAHDEPRGDRARFQERRDRTNAVLVVGRPRDPDAVAARAAAGPSGRCRPPCSPAARRALGAAPRPGPSASRPSRSSPSSTSTPTA